MSNGPIAEPSDPLQPVEAPVNETSEYAYEALIKTVLMGIAAATVRGATQQNIGIALIIAAIAVDPEGYGPIGSGGTVDELLAAALQLRLRMVEAGILRDPTSAPLPAAAIPGAGPSA